MMIHEVSQKNKSHSLFLFNFLHILHPHISRSDGEAAGEFDKDAAGFADAYYFAGDAGEGAVLDADGLAFTEFGADLGEVDEVLVEGGCDLHEVVHLAFGNGDGVAGGAVPGEVDRGFFAVGGDEFPESLAGGECEAEIVYRRDQDLDLTAFGLLLFPHHRHECADAPGDEFFLHLEFAGVTDPEGVPSVMA